jgi:hypothetical protein
MDPSPPKQRIGLRVMEALGVKKPQSQPDTFNDMMHHHFFLSSQLHDLVGLLKEQLKFMEKHNDSRLKVIRQVVAMSETTPIAGVIASPLSRTEEDDDTLKELDDTFESLYAQLHLVSYDAQAEFKNDICRTAQEWDVTVSARVKKTSTVCEKLRRDLEHYVRKVDDLAASIERSESQEKVIADSVYERKVRNDEKLAKARETYETNVHDLCLYLKEVTEHGWKDLVPMILRIVNLDISFARDQEEITAKLGGVVEDLREIAEKNDFHADVDRIEALKADPPSTFASPDKGSSSRPSSHTDDEDETYVPFSSPIAAPRPTPTVSIEPATSPIEPKPTAPLAPRERPGTPESESIYTDGDRGEGSFLVEQSMFAQVDLKDDPEESF